jgi:hypothetical protein
MIAMARCEQNAGNEFDVQLLMLKRKCFTVCGKLIVLQLELKVDQLRG